MIAPDDGWGRSEFIETGGLRVHVRTLGDPDAPPVLLLHGFPQDSWMWRHQAPVLAEQYRVIAPDTRGFGHTEKTRIRVTREVLANDQVALLDALDIEDAALVGHDWGGIIAFKAAVDHPERFNRLALIDTLTSVWIPWGIHGYWFKCEPLAEQFFAEHGRAYIRSLYGGERRDYGGPPETPWVPVEGGEAMAQWDPSRFYTPEDVDHYTEVFADPDAWFNAIQYYRNALPFHFEHEGRLEFASNPQVAEIWHHPLSAHPDRGRFPVFAPEDLHKQYEKPTLYLFSPFLMRHAFADGMPDDDYIVEGNPYADSFRRHFPDLRCRGANTGHFVPEEDPARTNEVLSDFLAARI
jgi:pimeloyl-ACP methyl ester carboxylesterase